MRPLLTTLFVPLAMVTVFQAHSAYAVSKVDSVDSVDSVNSVDSVDLNEFNHVDRQREVPRPALRRALFYYKQYGANFKNHKYVAVADFSKHSSEPRLFIVNVKSGEVESLHVAHGKGSDPANSGWAGKFSNKPSSNATSLGFYKTGEIYSGEHGRSMKLDGLSATNNNARSRGVVVHAAWYVREAQARAGRSQGCLTVDPKERDLVLSKLKGGALVYAWAGQGTS